ncbi:hypothetical protein [Aridibaculum aurantiacum]|uniref:hypothetical protein n=1 Tax=Aridibaculum aurantiacum TaxID=2810307 RepID=UPI001A976999|nr:hypothetical protein [Aridibaculum aurantiacum]
MRHVLIIILTIFIGVCHGQNFSYPSILVTGQNIPDFVPAGWTVLDSAYGDLNKDGVTDAAIVIQHKDSISMANSVGDTVLTQPRMLLILFRNAAHNSFALVEQSNTFILRHDNPAMEDPYLELAINKGIL